MASCSIPQYEQHLTAVSICLERIQYQWSKGGVGDCISYLFSCFLPYQSSYSSVCGRAIGYQIGTTVSEAAGYTFGSFYIYYGFSVTHSALWNIISRLQYCSSWYNYLKDDSLIALAAILVILITYQHLCLLEITTTVNQASNKLFLNFFIPCTDALRDGQQFEGQCCSNGKSQWFSVELPNPTTDDTCMKR